MSSLCNLLEKEQLTTIRGISFRMVGPSTRKARFGCVSPACKCCIDTFEKALCGMGSRRGQSSSETEQHEKCRFSTFIASVKGIFPRLSAFDEILWEEMTYFGLLVEEQKLVLPHGALVPDNLKGQPEESEDTDLQVLRGAGVEEGIHRGHLRVFPCREKTPCRACCWSISL